VREKPVVSRLHSLKNRAVAHPGHSNINDITQEAKMKKVLAAALAAGMLAAAGAHAAVIVHIADAGGNVNVTASGSLDLTGAVYDHQQAYSTGIIPGGSNWYVALGNTPGLDWYRLISTTLPFGTSTNYFTSGLTSGDGFSIWGFSGGTPLVGLASGYTSGDAISSSMVLTGQSIAGMTLIPGTYTFALPADTITPGNRQQQRARAGIVGAHAGRVGRGGPDGAPPTARVIACLDDEAAPQGPLFFTSRSNAGASFCDCHGVTVVHNVGRLAVLFRAPAPFRTDDHDLEQAL
jgi:hypothetical protein